MRIRLFPLLLLASIAYPQSEDPVPRRPPASFTPGSGSLTDAYKYRFIDFPHQSLADFHTNRYESVPAKDFGEMFLDADANRFVYRLWSNRHPRPNAAKNDGNDQLYMMSIAGYDGKAYWVATCKMYIDKKLLGLNFKEVKPAWHAQSVFVYPAAGDLGSESMSKIRTGKPSDDYGAIIGNKIYGRHVHRFYSAAPLHNLLSMIERQSFDSESLVGMLEKSEYARRVERDHITGKGRTRDWPMTDEKAKYYFYEPQERPGQEEIPPHWRATRGGFWCYTLEISENYPAIRRCYISHLADMWTGRWPFPTPHRYTVVLDEKVHRINDCYYGYRMYCDTNTKISTAGSDE